MDIEKKLMEIGLERNEAKVYLQLLENEDCLASAISKRTNINRSVVYSVLDSLTQKGFASYIIKNSTRVYRAANPSKIKDMLEERKKEFDLILPNLLSIKKIKSKKPIVEILEGREGFKTILNDLLRQKKDWFAFNIPGKGPEIMGPMVHAFEKDRQKAKIKLRAICVKTKDGTKRGKEFSSMNHTSVKYMPKEYESPASNWVYGDRVVIIFWYKDFPFAVRTIDKNLAESYKNQFMALWETLR